MALKLHALMAAVLLATVGGIVEAQPAAAPPASQPGASSAPPAKTAVRAASVPPTGALTHRSAFEGYRPFAEQPVGSWREANDVVGRIGGWKAYARESQGGSAADDGAATPSSQDMPAMPGMPAGHGNMAMQPSGSGTPAPMSPATSSPGPSPTPSKGVPPLPRAAASPASSSAPASPAAPPATTSGGHSGHKSQ